MAKKSPSGIALLNQNNSLGKNTTNPKRVDKKLMKLDQEGLEWVPPLRDEYSVIYYKGQSYKITKEGKLLGLDGKEMKPFFHKNKRWPRFRVKKHIKRWWKFEDVEWEVGIFKLMDRYFGAHIKGYREKKKNPKAYILVTKDGLYENLSRDNLEYVDKKLYRERWSKREQIKQILQFQGKDIRTIAEKTWISQPHIRRVREELWQEGKADAAQAKKRRVFKEENNIECTLEQFPIYKLFLETKWSLSNLEMAQMLFPDAYRQAKTNEEKKNLTASIVRVRKRLQDQGKISKDLLRQKRNKVIEMLDQKEVSGYANKEIAKLLGLKKEQVDNLARQVKKERTTQ